MKRTYPSFKLLLPPRTLSSARAGDNGKRQQWRRKLQKQRQLRRRRRRRRRNWDVCGKTLVAAAAAKEAVVCQRLQCWLRRGHGQMAVMVAMVAQTTIKLKPPWNDQINVGVGTDRMHVELDVGVPIVRIFYQIRLFEKKPRIYKPTKNRLTFLMCLNCIQPIVGNVISPSLYLFRRSIQNRLLGR